MREQLHEGPGLLAIALAARPDPRRLGRGEEQEALPAAGARDIKAELAVRLAHAEGVLAGVIRKFRRPVVLGPGGAEVHAPLRARDEPFGARSPARHRGGVIARGEARVLRNLNRCQQAGRGLGPLARQDLPVHGEAAVQ